jgi:hypothetical protein
LGFYEFASNLFDAPLPVRAQLCATCKLDHIPIGGQAVDGELNFEQDIFGTFYFLDESEAIAARIGEQYGLFMSNKCRVRFENFYCDTFHVLF